MTLKPDARRACMVVALLTLTMLVSTSCATMHARAYLPSGVSFQDYQTYGWSPADSLATGDPRLDNNQIFDAWVRASIDAALGRRGFEQVTASELPDLLVHYHASLSQQIDVRDLDRGYGPPYDDRAAPFVYDAGTLLVDLIDARTHQLVWRGWAEGSFEGVLDNQRWTEQRVDQAIERIFRRLPPGSHGADARARH